MPPFLPCFRDHILCTKSAKPSEENQMCAGVALVKWGEGMVAVEASRREA
jgi:hypothetical protein